MKPASKLLMLAALAIPSSADAQGSKVSSAPELARQIDALKPGQWVWAPAIATSGPVMIYVDLSKQIALVYRNGIRIGASTISSGKDGHETPTGVFTILQKDANHRSSVYNNAPMPFQQRLTWDGVALHAGGLPGYPESHGCVHLPYEFARALFAITNLGITVIVQGSAADHVRTSENSLLAPFDAKGQPAPVMPLTGEAYRWTPEAAPQGPLTIIVSKLDQRIVVLRNGMEIGRSVAQIKDDDPGSHVINLVIRDGKPHWVYVGLPGHGDEDGHEVDEAILNRVRMPRRFYELVRDTLKPGATILVTNSRVGAKPLERLTIMDAVVPQP
ncbi:L,D-transpeptidase family protein [Sphingobium sp. BHU LFT2]|uniref:L,D-transpeptidase family protein n=1 Tax=Sphingobium sp. BHU LFT2 TaxID=2807634 RepID=UPI001BE51A19|nr:L,D-transpeptidase family protein [Sphingobium sp. BHU LFT2]MBT2246876.1 L,D-transpeptidase family protein [Sphingobium sp. BHU LFT2]